jgi:hypothetical protein
MHLMDIHKPKPIHGWREFFKEYAIIVIGVATALAAEQAVEWWHWKSQVAEARSLIASELARNVRQSIIRLRIEACGERRLDELGAILDNASRTGALPPVGDIGSPPRSIWYSGTWESVVASQAAVHFPRQELAALNTIYKFIQKADESSAGERMYWDSLYAMVGPGRRLDPASDARLRDALSHARASNREMTVMGTNITREVKALNLPFSPNDLNVIAAGEHLPLVKPRNEFSFTGYVCAPIEKAPAVYGQAMWTFVPYRNDASLKAVPNFGQKAY